MTRRTYTIRSVMPAGTVIRVGLAGVPATPDLGNGGWSIAQRPKRVAATEWIGLDPIVMQVPSLLDGFAKNRSVERDLYRLETVLRSPTKATKQPAVLTIKGPIPFASPNVRWVLAGMDYGDQERRSSDGARIRAFFTLTFMQYIPADVLVKVKASPAKEAQERNATNGNATPSSKSYTIKAGETLWGVAQWHLGNGSRWTEIAELNGIRDPKRVRAGTVLRLP